MAQVRTVFIVSDRTGITAETLGHSLLTQFDAVKFNVVTVPFLNTPDKARALVSRIAAAAAESGRKPLVFSTLVDDELRAIVSDADAQVIDFFDAFIGPLERELGIRSTHASGKAHGMADYQTYTNRIEAMNFALANDDGVTTRHYGNADVVLVGVSRSGKTPTSLYLALQYGLYAANFPLTADDLERGKLPSSLLQHRQKLFGLTIDADRLAQIRNERRPDSRYAANDQVRFEVRSAEALFSENGIPCINTTHMSIEEIATTIMHTTGLKRRTF
jgi:[pyruvate, water dikinase]-phosphate phosphotransferase / [pyruvate, water dikinase] kinase